MKSLARAVALVSLFLPVAASAFAQEERDPSEGARFQWGPVRFTPGIAISDVGFDNNVFNDAEHQLSDTTAAVGPAINLWTKLGRVRVAVKSSGQYLYFKQFENQRSWNTANEVKVELPLAHIKPFAIGSYANTRQRPGFEIDSRARSTLNVATLGTELRLSGKTSLILSGSRATTAFDENDTYLGATLAEALNRYSDTETAQLRYSLTPLTTLVVSADAVQDRFAADRIRNTDSIALRPCFEFKPFALVAGVVSVGVRHFNVLNDNVQDFQGLVTNVGVSYTLTTTTQISARINRDLAFSFSETTPYYAVSDSGLAIKQRIASSWDVEARGGWQALAYRGLTTQTADGVRTDKGRMFGAGIGYLVGETFRIGVDVNYYSRRSPLALRDYDGLRAGASVSYGMQR